MREDEGQANRPGREIATAQRRGRQVYQYTASGGLTIVPIVPWHGAPAVGGPRLPYTFGTGGALIPLS